MTGGGSTQVKVCCMQSAEEVRLAVEAGASAVGFVSSMPSGFGPIPEERIAEIAADVPAAVLSVLLTCLRDPERIADQQRRTGKRAVQLCDRLEDGGHAVLRRALPGVRLIQVVHVTGEEALAEAEGVAPQVDALLLDSGNPGLAVKELGGTGRVHDWAVSRRIREAVRIPVYLAGGLTRRNVARAIAEVRPFAVDVCTGLRVGGRLDPEELRGFFREVRAAGSPHR